MSKQPTREEIQARFSQYKQELQSIIQKINELEGEKEEHQLVINTISPMNEDRKCFRLVGGVLVERTVKEVLPAVQTNLEGITTIMKQLAETYKKKEDDFVSFQKQYNITVKG